MKIFRKIISGIQEAGFHFINEIKTIFKDSGAFIVLVAAVILYPIIYSFAYKQELVRDLKIAVVDLDHSAASRQLARMIDATEQLKVVSQPSDFIEAKNQFFQEDVNAVMVIPDRFEKEILKGNSSPVSIYCDASYMLMYKQTLTGAIYASSTLGAGIEIKKMMAKGVPEKQAYISRDPLALSSYDLYNPVGGYGTFVMPGMIIIILQQTLLVGIGMIGGTRREQKAFYQEFHKHSKGNTLALLLGKASAYTFLYLLNAIITLIWINRWFQFPEKGNLWDVLILMIPFLLSSSFLGLTISVLFRKREHAMMFMVFLSPIILFLSGLSWPATSIPHFLHQLANIFPSTFMVPAYLRVRTMGVELFSVGYELMWMCIQVLVYFVLAFVAFRYIAYRNKKKSLSEHKQHDGNII